MTDETASFSTLRVADEPGHDIANGFGHASSQTGSLI